MTDESLRLFDEIELVPTIAMHAGTQHLFQCKVCGTLACVPSSSKRSNIMRQVQRELGACPRCGKAERNWSHLELGVGPFHWRQT